MQSIDIPLAELGEKNIFEEVFELLEKHRLNLDDYFPLGNFYDVVNDFDITFQKFNSTESNGKYLKVYNDMLNYSISNFLTIFKVKGFRDEPIFYAFKRFIAYFSMILREADRPRSHKDIIRNFFENFPSLKINITNLENEANDFYINYYGEEMTPHQASISKFETNFPKEIGIKEEAELFKTQLAMYCNDFVEKTIVWDEASVNYTIIDEQFYMFLEITIDTYEKSAEKLISPLWLITSALEKIDNVTLELTDIAKGSINATIKIWMKNLLAKEEAKAVLETTKELVVKTLSVGEVSYTEVKKSRQETKKLSLENIKLETELNQAPSDKEVKFDRALDIQRKMLENERMEIDNTKAKLEVIDQLSGLATKGIIEADMIRININEILYILKEKDEIKEIGPDISEIS